MVSHPETGSDPPIGSDQESGRDMTGSSFSLSMPILSKAEAKMIRLNSRCRLGPDGPFC